MKRIASVSVDFPPEPLHVAGIHTRGLRLPWSVGSAAGYFSYCLLVQALTGAWQTGFIQYPDEPSHFVGAALIRDWLFSGHWTAPLQFAHQYYAHYPFLGIGYWPPLFHTLTAIFFVVGGVGKVQALIVPAACAASTAWLISRLLLPRMGFAAAVCVGTVYLTLPTVQRWMCAVMVDHMTALFCLAVAFCLIRYLEQPNLKNGILWAVLCACAILSKYSAVYLVALPWAAVLLFRRSALLSKASFLIQPVIVGLLVGPWVLWTRRLSTIGLPSERPALTGARAGSFIWETLNVFPPAILIIILVGLLAVAVLPKCWQTSLGVVALLFAAHLLFLFLSPVEPERRYLLVPAAALLVASSSGWTEALVQLLGWKMYSAWTVASVAVLTTVSVFTYFGSYPRSPRYPIKAIVATVVTSRAWAGEHVLVPADLEGPFIAEFVAQERHPPASYLVRPGKVLTHENWFGRDYSLRYQSVEEVLQHFRKDPVTLIIWHGRPEAMQTPHEHLLGDMLRQNPLVWRKAASFSDPENSVASWALYEYMPAVNPARAVALR